MNSKSEEIWVFEGMRVVGRKESAAIAAEFLNGDHSGHGARCHLYRASLHRVKLLRPAECHRHAIERKDNCNDHRKGQQNAGKRANEVLVEIAEIGSRSCG